MSFPWIGLFWGMVWGLVGIYLYLPIMFTLSMGLLCTVSTLMVRNWIERLHGIDRYRDA